MKQQPVFHKFLLMQFRPSFHKTTLSSRKGAGKQFYRFDGKHGNVILIMRMEVRHMVRTAYL